MKPYLKYLIPVITGAIGVIIGGIVDWKKEDALEDKKFEYRIIEKALEEDKHDQAAKKLKFMMDIGLISSLDTGVINAKINREELPVRGFEIGRHEGLASGDLMKKISLFYKKENRVPKSLAELNAFQSINLNVQIIGKEHVSYRTSSPKNFELRFAGKDQVLATNDDRIYGFEDLR